MRPRSMERARDVVMEFVRRQVEDSGGNGVVIGLSGGLDSAVVSKLCCDAIGPDRVLNIHMPCSTPSGGDLQDAEDLCRLTGASLCIVDIGPAVEAFRHMLPGMDGDDVAGNVMARCRMIVLFHHARLTGRVVMGTSNRSEIMIGYFTKFGDGGADHRPIGDLYKTEVRELAKVIGIPQSIIDKSPSAGLWEGQTDEGDMGIPYDDLDRVLSGLEHGLDDREVASATSVPIDEVIRVRTMCRDSAHKRAMPSVPRLDDEASDRGTN